MLEERAMIEQRITAEATHESRGPSVVLLTVLAVATGLLIANLYYAQPLVGSIGPDIGVSRDLAGSIVSLCQIGYGIGLFLIVPLADLLENKRLVLGTLVLTTLGLVGAALAATATPFFIAMFVIGVCSTGAQVLLPFVAHLAPPARRGRIVGNVMAGVLTGIMAARPIALFIGGAFGWRAVFWMSAVVMVVIGLALWRMMPRHKPHAGMHYGKILLSMLVLFRKSPIVRRRAVYQALMFAAFNMFWTAAPLMLSDRYHMSQQSIGFFALAGAGGALAAPIAGRLADRGLFRITTAGLMLMAGLSFYVMGWAAALASVVPLAVLTILFDAAIQGNQVVSQRIIFSGPVETRGRINAIYMTTLFFGGGLGSVGGTFTYHRGGWMLTAGCGGLIGVAMLAFFATELLRRPSYRIADM